MRNRSGALTGALILEYEINALAKYNAEVARGIVHTEEWKIKMEGYQSRFDGDQLKRAYDLARSMGGTVEETPLGIFVMPAPRKRRYWWWKR